MQLNDTTAWDVLAIGINAACQPCNRSRRPPTSRPRIWSTGSPGGWPAIPLKPWRYRDFGSLVSLGGHSTVGNLMGGLAGRNSWLEGYFGWLMYVSLYKMYPRALHGPKAPLDTVARFLSRGTRPRVKLH